jgi:hypothetical protein
MSDKSFHDDEEEEEVESSFYEAERRRETMMFVLAALGTVFLAIVLLFGLSSCTLTFTNVTTHGKAGSVASDTISPTDDFSATVPLTEGDQ